MGRPFASPHCVSVSAAPGCPWSFWPWQSPMVSIILFLSSASVSSASHPLSMSLSGFGFCCLAHLFSLSPFPQLSPSSGAASPASSLGSLQSEVSFQPLGPSCVGSCPSGWLSCCRLALGWHRLPGMSWAGEGLYGLVQAAVSVPLHHPRAGLQQPGARAPSCSGQDRGCRWMCAHIWFGTEVSGPLGRSWHWGVSEDSLFMPSLRRERVSI